MERKWDAYVCIACSGTGIILPDAVCPLCDGECIFGHDTKMGTVRASTISTSETIERHKLSTLDDEQRRALLTYYRHQESVGALAIKASEFQDGDLLVVNYTDSYNEATAPADWDWRMELARGSVFFEKSGCAPEVVVQPMPKFHGYNHCPEALRHVSEDGPLKIMQKHDGSCISITCFRGEVLLFTRGARQSVQTQLARQLLNEASMTALEQMEGRTIAVELIHKLDGKVEQNRGPNRLVLLYACEAVGHVVSVEELPPIAQSVGLDCVAYEVTTGNELKRQIEALNSISLLEEMREGFVVEIAGKKYKVKPQIYKTIAGNRRAPPIPQPNEAWMARCFSTGKNLSDVRREVEKMQAAPLDYGSLARCLLEKVLACADENIVRLRGLHSSFSNPKELGMSQTVSKADKLMLFPCVKLPADEREAWFDGEEFRFVVAQNVTKRFSESSELPQRGFQICQGRLVLCGAPGKKDADSWAVGLNCVVTLLREDELRERGLNLTAILGPLKVERQHFPISGASLAGSGDRDIVKAAAKAVADRLKSGLVVAVHCSAGLHRTGIVGYLALRLLGHSRPAAFERLGQVRWETRVELEKIFYRNKSSAPKEHANLVSIAEELLLDLSPLQNA